MLRILVAIALSGCSFATVNGPATMTDTDCTTSRVAPIVDASLGTLFVLGSISAFIDSRSPTGRPHAGEAALAILAVAAVFTASAYVGFDRVGDCRDVGG